MASKVNERENLVKEISKIKKNIRQKHYALTQDIMNVEQQMEKSLKPITEPLKLLIEKEKKPKAIEKKINDSQDIEMDDIEPVSYTHLDVYKRQNLYRSLFHACSRIL